MANGEAAQDDPRLEELRTRALGQLERLEQAARVQRESLAEVDDVRIELARTRLEAGGSVRAFHRAIDTLMSW